ncbi:phosphotransferase [Aliikangiella sp. IMCC44653]
MKTPTQPNWWPYSATSWQQLSVVVATLDVSCLEELSNEANWRPQAGGVTNFNYCLTLGHKKLFVQMIDASKLERLPQKNFYPICKLLSHNQKIQPWLAKCYLDAAEIRIFEWLDAMPLSAEYFDDSQNIDQLCLFLSYLHADIGTLPILNMKAHLQHYYDLAVAAHPEKETTYTQYLKQGLIFSKSFVPSKTCHNDLSPGNILKGDSLYIIDWEYCCISDPLFDLAGVSLNFNLNSEQELRLLKCYSNLSSTFFHKDKFYEMKSLYDLVCKLWDETQ